MAIRNVVTNGYGNGTYSGTIGEVVTSGYSIGAVVTVTPRTTVDFVIKLPPLKVHALVQDSVPFLTDEAGAILFAENGQPLISEQQKTFFIIKPPTLKARKVN